MEQNITVAEALIKFLHQNGINTVFGVVGDAVFSFFDALGKQIDVKFYGTSHESGAAFMASYYAKLTGKAGVCVAADRHPVVIGGVGEAYVPSLLTETDGILLIGNASFEMKFLPSSAKIIQIADAQEDLDYSIITKGIVGDLRQIIKVLSERISHNRNQAWKNKIAQEKQNLENLIRSQEQNKTTPIHPAYLMTTLTKVLPEDSVIVCDIGGFIHWFDAYFQAANHTITGIGSGC